MSLYQSTAATAHGERMAAEREQAAARETERRRLLTEEEAAALTVAQWEAMSFEERNRLYASQPAHYQRLRDASLGNSTAAVAARKD